MKFDSVHDIQSVYRKLVDVISRPGELINLEREYKLIKEEHFLTGHETALLLALTMLDQEVTFKVVSEMEEHVSSVIYGLTNAKPVQLQEADYIFVLVDAKEGELEQAIRSAKAGTLYNPHQSAMIVAETGSLSNGTEFLLKGPGIRETNLIQTDLHDGWMEARLEKNKEYPLGIDLILIDSDQQMIAIPRTTQMTENKQAVM